MENAFSARSLRALVFVASLVGCGHSSTKVATPPPPTVQHGGARAPSRRPPVDAPRVPVVRSYFGTSVVDEYEWLEDGQASDVRAFVDAQNALTRATLDALPERAAVRARVASILDTSSPDWTSAVHAGGRLFALKTAPPKQQRMLVDLGPVSSSRVPDPSAERVVFDPNVLDPGGSTTIDFFVPSPDGRIVAVSLSKGGTESGDVHFFEVATGKERPDVIARVQGGTAGGSVAWNGDGSAVYYTRYPRTGERPEADLDFYQQVYLHKLGAADASDSYVIGKEFPRIAEVELERSDDGKRILARVANGDGGEVEHHVLEGGTWLRLSRFEDELGTASFAPDGKIYAVSRKAAPRGKVIAFAPPFDRVSSIDVVPEGDAVIEDVRVTKSAIYTIESDDGPARIRRFPLDAKAEPLAREPKPAREPKREAKAIRHGKPSSGASKPSGSASPKKPDEGPTTIPVGARGPVAAVLPLPSVSNVSGVVRVGDDLLLRIESYVDAPAWLVYRASEHRLVPTAIAKRAAYDSSDVEVVRETCSSKDGTKVPMSILRRRGVRLDHSMPAYLTGYGGFGISVKPRQRTAHRVWLDHGGVVAEANLRGGGERGEAWHRAGSLTNKQNVFDDFAACASRLVELGYTAHERLAISGRSNGGLLVGAALVQHPELYRAAVASVGIYDMLRTELGANGAFNVTEFGSVKDPSQFRALHAYSPLHHVTAGSRYPAVLFTTGANDPRVDPYHSRKMVARLQAATSSDRPILLRESSGAGHGMGTPLGAEIEELTDVLAFLLHEVGLRP